MRRYLAIFAVLFLMSAGVPRRCALSGFEALPSGATDQTRGTGWVARLDPSASKAEFATHRFLATRAKEMFTNNNVLTMMGNFLVAAWTGSDLEWWAPV